MPFPSVSNEELERIQGTEPTAFRLSYKHPDSGESFGDVVLRKPRRTEVRRFKDAAANRKSTEFLVRACLLAPNIEVWDEVTDQELSGMPETVENDLLKHSGILAESAVGK